jgi:ribonuclease P protein component
MTVTHLPGEGGVRVAYAVGRRVGPAVVRNRVRRRLRAAVRELDRSGAGLADGAYLIAVRPGAADRSYRELRADLAEACAAATGRPV